ncbi:MAG: protein kinase, partial [Candidatus Binatia bacterium]
GVVLGTAAYMSPEQARGKPLDKRTDIWSFGCVLYECLTGIRPFLGETASDTIAKILERDPDWDGLSIETPPLVRALLRRCLQKDRKQRLHDIGDARIEMAEVSEAVPGLEAAERFATATRMPARTWKVAALVLAAAAVAGWLSAYRHWVSPNSVYRLSFGLPAKQGIATDMDVRLFDITDDGRAVVWLSQEEPRRIYYRSLDSHEVRAVPGTEGAENLCIALSPDGRDVLFVRGRALWRAQLEGGAAQKLLEGETATAIWDFDWAENGSILISLAYVGLARLRGPGAALERLTQCDAEQQGAHAWVRSLPGGRAAIFTVGNIESGVNNLALLMLDGSEPPIRTLLEDVWFAEYVPTGHLLFVRDGTLFAVVFDLDSLAVRGPAAPVLPNVQMDIFARIGEVAASRNGTLVYLPEQGIHDSRLAWIDREGDVEFLPLAEGSYYNPRVSPDGGRISVTHRKRGSRYPSVSLYDVRRSILQQFCKERSSVYSGVWSADGSRIAFSAGGNLYIKPADGGSPALRLGESRIPVDPLSFSPNGEVLLGAQRLPRDRFRLVAVDVVNGGSPQPITAEGVSEISGVFSPDGRWIAYVSDEEGQAEVFIRGIAGGDISLGRKERVSRNGGWHPAWAPGGDALFYLDDNASRLLAVSVLTEPRLELGDTKVVLEFSNLELELPKPDWLDAGRPYDVSADGRRFLVAARQGAGREMQVNVTLNWFEELKAKVPTGK